MPLFSFEIARHGRAPFVAQTHSLPDHKAAWCHVEALALEVENSAGASIRVKNAEGAIVILAGVATALATIGKCRCPTCPIKYNKTPGQKFFGPTARPAKALPSYI